MGMRRDARRTLDLVKRLEEEGLTLQGRPITGIMLEELDGDRMLRTGDDDAVVETVRALGPLDYGRGKKAAETSLRLLARGVAVPRAQEELVAFGDWVRGLSAALGEAGPDELDATAMAWVGLPKLRVIAPLTNRIAKAVKDVPEFGREDYAGALVKETADDRAVAISRAAVGMVANELPENLELFVDVLWSLSATFRQQLKRSQMTHPDTIDTAEQYLNLLVGAIHDYPARARSASLEELTASAAAWMKYLTPEVTGLGDRELEVLAALSAPLPIPDTAQ